MNKQIEEIITDYTNEEGFQHIDVYFVGEESGETVAVISDHGKVFWKNNLYYSDPRVNEAIQAELKNYTSQDHTSINGDGLHDWSGYTKVVPMALCQEATQSGNTWWEECQPEEAVYFSVRLKQNEAEGEDEEMWVQVAQFNTEAQAVDFQDLLQTILTLDLPGPN